MNFSVLEFCLTFCNFYKLLASWSSGNAFISGASRLRFKSSAGLVVTARNCCDIFFEGSCLGQAMQETSAFKLVTRFGVTQRKQ